MTEQGKETFCYTYSAKEQDEIRAIRKKYALPEEDKLAQLRRLDAAVTGRATAVSLVFGVAGALILGTGMSLSMTELGEIFGLTGGLSVLLGSVIGIAGIVLVCLAYPLYGRTVKKEREKIAPEILHLTDELMK